MDFVSRAPADGRRRTPLEIRREHPFTSGRLADSPPVALSRASRDLKRSPVARLLGERRQARRCTRSLRRPERLADVDARMGDAGASWRSRLDTLHIEITNGRKTR
ncbi:MAG: hypothetical protein QOD35_2993 [Nocardioidaceae bacterium]|jgi:hypothetical protein|nr:hypothetical protein [Nocardioidaceae bacterium]